jgi:hypothetical protein
VPQEIIGGRREKGEEGGAKIRDPQHKGNREGHTV